jgi:hypothetical protein
MNEAILCLMALAPLALGGCLVSPEPESGPPACQDGLCGDDDDDDLVDPVSRPALVPEVVAGVTNLFRAKCADCHGKGQSFGGLPDLFDVPELKRRNLIGANADGSVLFNKIKDPRHGQDVMNPRTGRPPVPSNAQDLRFVRRWLDAGAPDLRGHRQRLDLAAYADRLRADATKAPGAGDLAYVDFHAAYNDDRFSDAELSALANATIRLLNQLDVRSAAPKREGAAVVRDDGGLPLAVRFQASAFGLDRQRDIVGTLARLANRQDSNAPFDCAVPAIPALDFLHIAASDDVFNPLANDGQGAFESGYSNIALRRLLVDAGRLADGQLVFEPVPEATFVANGFTNVSAGVDLYDALAAVDPVNFSRPSLDALYNAPQGDDRLVRGCLVDSDTSAVQRCVDRLAQAGPANRAVYLSFGALTANYGAPGKDFVAARFWGPSGPAADPLVRPVGDLAPFAIDGGQGIVQLKNALLGFFSFDADLRLVSNATTYAALEDASPARTPFASTAACAHCHQGFAVPFQDVMLPTLISSLTSRDPDDLPPQFKIAQDAESWDQTFDLDQQRYYEALRPLYPVDGRSATSALPLSTPPPASGYDASPLHDGVSAFGPQYRYDLSNEDVVAELGLADEKALFDALDTFSELADISAPLSPAFGGGISRDNFTVSYQLLVELVGDGNEDFLRGCVARTTEVITDAKP